MLYRVCLTAISVVVLILSSVTPYIGLKRKDAKNPRSFCPSSKLLPLFMCFSCGVFLSTCFLGLLPHLNENEHHIKAKLNSTGPEQLSNYETFLNSNLMIMIGFLSIVLVEQSIFFCMPGPDTSNRSNRLSTRRTEAETADTSLNVQTDNHPLVRFNSETSDSDEGIGRIEFRAASSRAERGGGGHSHSHGFVPIESSFIQSFILLFALSVHSIFEGIALGAQQSDNDFTKFLVAIMMHEVLCSFAYGVRLSNNNVSLKLGFLSILFLSVSLPIGIAIISFITSTDDITSLLVKFVLEGMAAGILIYVATVEMLADELNHSHSNQGFFKGVFLAIGVFTFFVFNYLIRG